MATWSTLCQSNADQVALWFNFLCLLCVLVVNKD